MLRGDPNGDLRERLALYAVVPEGLGERALVETVEAAIEGGVGFVQLREKGLDDASYADLARRLRETTGRHGVPLVVNDSVEAAIASGADGVHVGQSDCDAAEARRRLPPGSILGVSVNGVDEARAAERAGADYLGVGAVFPTSTKPDARDASIALLSEICASVSIPVVAIGGISADNARLLSGTGIAGIAVVSALFGPAGREFGAAGTREAARVLRAAADELLARESAGTRCAEPYGRENA